MHTRTHMPTLAHTHKHMHTHTRIYTLNLTEIRTYAHINTHSPTRTYTLKQMQNYAYLFASISELYIYRYMHYIYIYINDISNIIIMYPSLKLTPYLYLLDTVYRFVYSRNLSKENVFSEWDRTCNHAL